MIDVVDISKIFGLDPYFKSRGIHPSFQCDGDIVNAIVCSHDGLFLAWQPWDRTLSVIVGQICMGELPTIVCIDALTVP